MQTKRASLLTWPIALASRAALPRCQSTPGQLLANLTLPARAVAPPALEPTSSIAHSAPRTPLANSGGQLHPFGRRRRAPLPAAPARPYDACNLFRATRPANQLAAMLCPARLSP